MHGQPFLIPLMNYHDAAISGIGLLRECLVSVAKIKTCFKLAVGYVAAYNGVEIGRSSKMCVFVFNIQRMMVGIFCYILHDMI